MAYSSKCEMTVFEIQTRDIHTPPKRASLIGNDPNTQQGNALCGLNKWPE